VLPAPVLAAARNLIASSLPNGSWRYGPVLHLMSCGFGLGRRWKCRRLASARLCVGRSPLTAHTSQSDPWSPRWWQQERPRVCGGAVGLGAGPYRDRPLHRHRRL